MAVFNKITTLANQLFPKGRAFKNVFGGVRERLIVAISGEWERLWNNMLSLMDSAIPDINGFDESDASAWERFYGINDGGLAGLSLEERRLAILQKMNFPNGQTARQHFKFVEEQLRIAGFDVYINEVRSNTQFLNTSQLGDYQLGDFQLGNIYSLYGFIYIQNQLADNQLGNSQLGGYYTFPNKVVNYIEENQDYIFNTGASLRFVFFVSACIATCYL